MQHQDMQVELLTSVVTSPLATRHCAMRFVEVESLEKADEMCKAGLLWYGAPHSGTLPEKNMPWGSKYEKDRPSNWGDAWRYYILLED